jgi:hypothetical protein
VLEIRVSTTISIFTFFAMVATLKGRGKIGLNLNFLGIVKRATDDGKSN